MKTIFIGLLLLTRASYSHDGHALPGALPPAPHGGVVREASEGTGNAHDKELFFEVVYKEKKLGIYPLIIQAEKAGGFVSLFPSSELSNVKVKIEYPRVKKTENIVVHLDKDSYTADFDAKGVNRFIVHIVSDYLKETRTAKIQIEKK